MTCTCTCNAKENATEMEGDVAAASGSLAVAGFALSDVPRRGGLGGFLESNAAWKDTS